MTSVLEEKVLDAVLDVAGDRAIEGIAVAELADHVGYSQFHFTRLFTATMRIPPGQYLSALRMDAAKRLLLERDDAVIDIAAGVGFDSLSSFSRRFRTAVGVPPAALRRLADRVADSPVRPFRLVDDRLPAVRVRLRLPAELGANGTWSVWLGWYQQPAPVGLPASGMLVEYDEQVDLPLCPSHPWLLGFAVRTDADVMDQLAPTRPLVAVHPGPVRGPATVDLTFSRAARSSLPLLSALPSLSRAR